MSEQVLQSLFDAVQQLGTESSLALLNLNAAVLDDPGTTREYVDRFRHWQQLENVAASIPDLLKQDDEIALIGFLGHFSSGKSSLINALMEISEHDSPGYKRKVDTHPTDTEITLISHRDHADRVKVSSYTVVEKINVVHGPANELLEHATLVDTPGLGNEEQEDALLTRFLHLCHVLVMTIDGRRPFADKNKDFDLLDIAFNKLSGVPKLLAITCAEEFLNSRKDDFETGWNVAVADAFWAETVRRLQADPRFASHMDDFKNAPRFFVDSKEKFRVDELSAALLPIVKDNAHKARIRVAKARYVLQVAHESLVVLHRYISDRSANLNRLRTEAQSRADKTQTALEELLQALEVEFSKIRDAMQEPAERIPDLQFPAANIVSADAISTLHKRTLGRLAGEIKDNLTARLREGTTRLEGLAVAQHRAATRWWRPRKGGSSEAEVDVAGGLHANLPLEALTQAAVECGVDLSSEVNRQIRSKRREALGYLEARRERTFIGSRVREIRDALEHFAQKLDDAVRGFFAYVTQPSSRDLLKEHGFVGFDETGGRAVEPQALNVKNNAVVSAITTAAEECRESLKKLVEGDESDYKTLLAASDDEEPEEGIAIAETFPALVEDSVGAECRAWFATFQADLKAHLEKLNEEFQETKAEKTENVNQIWKARGTLLMRFLAVGLVVVLAGFGIEQLREGTWAALLAWLPDRTLANVVSSIATSLVILGLVFVLTGAKNPTVKAAIGLTTITRAKVYTTRRRQIKELRTYVRHAVDRLAAKISGSNLDLAPIIVAAKKKWLSDKSPSHRLARKDLKELEQRVRNRTEYVDEFGRVAKEKMALIPDELREAAEKIRTDAVERHMSRIREATDAVDNLKADISTILDTVGSAL